MSVLAPFGKAAWYVVHTKPKQEWRALEQLTNQQFLCYLPTLTVQKIRRHKLVTCDEPLFSRYLFIRLDHTCGNWSAIRSTRGVSGLVTIGGRYATLPDSWIEALQCPSSQEQRSLFAPGESVSIASGPFAGLQGIYQASDGDARALILVELMSQPQKLVFAVEMLRKSA